MNYICSFGLENPVRHNIAADVSLIKYGTKKPTESVKKGEKNSVNVRMISGDHAETCKFVAL